MTAVLPSARAFERLVDGLAREVGDRAAVCWAHATALTRHAAQHNLIREAGEQRGPDDVLRTLDALAGAHPALTILADPQVVELGDTVPSRARWEAVTRFWSSEALADDGHRVDGYRLGDAYQALSAEARRNRALCQTPPWVADLLLELSLVPAADELGTEAVRMIDPSCGTGHVLLSAFHKIRTHRPRGRSYASPVGREEGIERALRAVHGVDLDAHAVAVARYRLLAAAATVLGGPLTALPADWPAQVAVADALLDASEPMLRSGGYDAVVGNPPYITPRDAGTRDAVRRAYPEVCSGKFSLALPFSVLMTRLARREGWVAQLTANSFMKREFGRKFIEEYLPRLDLGWVIDTSGCYIPGHGTPTVILSWRNRAPRGDKVITVLGIRGEPRLPQDPARGLVWRAVEEAVHERLALERLRRGLEDYLRNEQIP